MHVFVLDGLSSFFSKWQRVLNPTKDTDAHTDGQTQKGTNDANKQTGQLENEKTQNAEAM